MKKKLLSLLGISLFALTLGACQRNTPAGPSDSSSVTPVRQTYTVAFEVDGARYKTLKVRDGETITEEVPDPAKEGFNFVGWYEGTTLVDLQTYVVTKNVTFTAKFEERHDGDVLDVDCVKEEGKTYYLVMGWWETTAMEDDGVTPKHTSNMNRDTTRLFYGNLNKYLLATGATQDDLDNISFRNYSSEKVADMGAAINLDADVDIMIGVGNNINSSSGANVPLYNGTNDSKFSTGMGSPVTDRYVALLSTATERGVEVYEWLKGTQAGKDAFLRELTDQEIEDSLVPETIFLNVIVHGDSIITTLLDSKDDVVEMPEITIPEGKQFKGFSTTEDGEVELDVAKDAVLKYDDVKDLVAEGADSLHLYPVFQDAPVVEDDLVVYVQINNGLTFAEAGLLEARFNSTLVDENVKFNVIEGSASEFTEALGDDADVVIGGNNPLKNYKLYDADNYPLVNAGAKHFADATRKVIIRDTVAASHVDLAKDLYNFVKDDAIAFEVTAAFWPKNGDWVTEDEEATMVKGMTDHLNTLLGIGETETLLDKYNVTLSTQDVAGTKVANLSADTLALNEGKGVDLIIGCGGNVDEQEGLIGVENKKVTTDFMAAGRYVALVHDNYLARSIFDNYFVEVSE